MEYKKNPKADVHRLRSMFFSFSLVASLSLIITAFEWKSTGDSNRIGLENFDLAFNELLEIPPTEQLPPPPSKIINPKIQEIPDDEEIAKDLDIEIDTEIKETSEIVPIRVEEIAKEETDEIFSIVEDNPEFPGGNAAFKKFIVDNMTYPRNASALGIEGKVFVKVIIGKDGSVSNLEIIKGIGAGCDEEALRVVGKSPNWKPGRQRGHPVRVSVIIPIVFKMS